MIWHLRLADTSRRYDLYTAFVVRAETADDARMVAWSYVDANHVEYRAACWAAGAPPPTELYARMADEADAWLDPARSTVTAVSAQGPTQVIVSSFKQG